jgi:hypothetical protein
MPEQQQQQQTVEGAAAAAGSSFCSAADPSKQLSHLLFLANAAANLPCVAAIKNQLQKQQLPQQQQQQQQQQCWCGLSFSGLPGLHVQLQQTMLGAVEAAGQLIRVCAQCGMPVLPASLPLP